jgi:hypothetical protein
MELILFDLGAFCTHIAEGEGHENEIIDKQGKRVVPQLEPLLRCNSAVF